MARIVVFLGALNGGGAERVAVWLAGGMARRGHRVWLATLASAEEDFYPCPPGVKRVSLGLTGAHAPLARLGANLKRVRALRHLVRTERATTIVAFMTHESVLAILATAGLPVRCVISERNAPWRRNPGRIWALTRRLTYPAADGVVVQTEAIANWMRHRVPKRLVHVIPNAVQDELQGNAPDISPHENIAAGRKLMLAVGGKPHQKGFDLLVSAFSSFAPDFPDWDLALVGVDGGNNSLSPQAVRLAAQISETGLTDRIHMPGPVGNILDWYDRADLFVLSSRFEGFPNVLVEAMAAGCACVATDCDTGPSELIADGVNGRLVRMDDLHALSRALADLAGDPDTRDRLGKMATCIRKSHAPEKITVQWEAVITGCPVSSAELPPVATTGGSGQAQKKPYG